MSAERTVMFQLSSMLSGTFACVAGTVAGRSWELSAGTFVIGRNEGCDLQLPVEPGVSKVHAKIIAEGDRYVIVDCESRNGTIVNGVPVQKQKLHDGDEVRICGCVLRFNGQSAGGGVKVRNIDQRAEMTDPSTPAPAPPAPMPEQERAPPAPPVAPPFAKGRVLALWYAFGLAGSLVFGGAATAVVVFSAAPAQADQDAVALNEGAPPAAVAAKADAEMAKADAPAADAAKVAGTATSDTVDDAAAAAAAKAEAANAEAAKAEAEKAQAAKAEAEKAVEATKAKQDPTAVAAAEKDLAADDEPADAPKVEKRKRRSSSASSTAASSEGASDEEGAGKTFRATSDGGKSETLRTRGGKVRAVDAKDGEMVSKGQTLVTFEEGENGDEVATLRDRIASLEGAEDEEARRDLKAAKAKLDALQGSKSAPIIAGMAGRLSGFSVGAGAVLKNGETVGRIVEGEAPRRVKVSVDRQTRAKRGQEVTLVLRRGGEGAGTVLAISGRTITIDTGDLAADEVESVRF